MPVVACQNNNTTEIRLVSWCLPFLHLFCTAIDDSHPIWRDSILQGVDRALRKITFLWSQNQLWVLRSKTSYGLTLCSHLSPMKTKLPSKWIIRVENRPIDAVCIRRWEVAAALQFKTLAGIRSPFSDIKAVFSLSISATSTCKYLNFKYCVGNRLGQGGESSESLMRGNGKASSLLRSSSCSRRTAVDFNRSSLQK